MKVVICVPYRATPSRAVIWDDLRPRYEAFGLPLFVSDSDSTKPFNVSEARNRAAEAAADDWDVAAFIDADVWVDPDMFGMLAKSCARTHNLTTANYQWVMNDDNTEIDYVGIPRGGAAILIPHDVFDLIGGWDERFVRWGGEDYAISLAAAALTGRHPTLSLGATIASFSHDRSPSDPWFAGGDVLPDVWLDYERAKNDSTAMANVVAEARAFRAAKRALP